LSDHETAWRIARPILGKRFTVYAIDRRGRGGSGPPSNHTIEQEYEDIAAVVNAVGVPVSLLGHSNGAHCALGAARLAGNVRKLVLYEPIPKPPRDPEHIKRLHSHVESGDPDGFLVAFLRLRPEQMDRVRSGPTWAEWRRFASATAKDRQAFEDYDYDPRKFGKMAVPTLLLIGEESPAWNKQVVAELADSLPDSQIVSLPGQGHFAMNTAPEQFAAELVDFLIESA
jgi:pimeloyl-ACP methyl ester carboxylesterase